MEDDDFEFVLAPATYWWTVNRGIWERYNKILRTVWGKKAYKVVEKTDGPGDVQWLVVEVYRPMMVSAVIMGAPTLYREGDTAESLAAFGAPADQWWGMSAEGLKDAVGEWAQTLHTVALGVATGGSSLLSKAGFDQVKKIAEDPGKFLKDAHDRLLKTVMVGTAAAIVGLVIYAKVSK